MNPSSSSYSWNNPPPPGTEFDSPEEDSSNISVQKNESSRSSERAIDRIDPYLKNPVYQGREEQYSSERTRYRSRSRSSDRYKRRKRSRSFSRHSGSHSKRSRSRSRDRYRRSRSRSRRRRRRYSSSRSRSRSCSSGHYRHRRRKHGRRHSQSRSRAYRSRTRSRSYSRSRSYRSDRDRKHSRSPRIKEETRDSESDKLVDGDIVGEEDMKIDEPEYRHEPEAEYDQGPVPFKNDGSFLEMFKKMQEMQKVKEETPEQPEPKKPLLPVFGKRRGGKVLKTGMVAKVRNVEEESSNAQDAWSVYMKEVRKYKEVHCDDDSKTRPLVK